MGPSETSCRPSMRHFCFVVTHVGLAILTSGLGAGEPILRVEPAKTFATKEARQAVALDAQHFYAIGNRSIGKYERDTGRRVASWEGEAKGPIQHLNSGVVLNGKLYCANSNYPELPMTSSVEIWDTATLRHVGNHSFGITEGSLTWVDWHSGHWWAGFAVYSGSKAPPGQDPSWTQVVQFDQDWRRLQGWVFPKSIVDKFKPMSNSGGSWGPDGLLYCTGHDHYELYALRIPTSGSTLIHVKTVDVASFGQGIAWDRSGTSRPQLWGIVKRTQQVVASHVPLPFGP